MSARELADRVRRLAEGLGAQPDLAAARALAAEGQALHDCVQQLQQLEADEQGRQQLRRALEQCTRELGKLSSRLKDKANRVSTFRLSLPQALAAADLLAEVVVQVTAGCHLSATCSALSRLAEAPAQDWQRLARSAYSLLHGGGLELLEFSLKCFAVSTAASPPASAAASMLLAQLHAAAAFANGMPVEQQVEARLLQPAQLRAWLTAAVHLLVQLRQSGQPGWVQQPVLPVLPELVSALYSYAAIERWWGIANVGSTEVQLMQLLMPAVPALAVALRLPAQRRPSGCSWGTAARLLNAFRAPSLGMARAVWFEGTTDSRSLVSALCGTAQLLALMEPGQPAADDAPAAGSAAGSAAPADSSAVDSAGSIATAGNTGPADLDPSILLALDALSLLGLLAHSAEMHAERLSIRIQERRRMARSLLPALERLPSLAAEVLKGAHRPGGGIAVMGLDGPYESIVQLLLSYTGSPAASGVNLSCNPCQLIPSFEDAAAWCPAVNAALRSISRLASYGGTSQILIHRLIQLASRAGAAAAELASSRVAPVGELSPTAAAGAAALMEGLWDLHTCAARLVHLVAAGSNMAVLQLTARESMLGLLGALSDSMTAAGVLIEQHAASVDKVQWRRRLEAMAVAHLPAMHVLAGAVKFADLDQRMICATAASGLSWAVVIGPVALATSPTLHTLLQQLLEGPFAAPAECARIFQNIAAAPLVVAHLWLSNQMELVLLRAAQHCTEAEAGKLAQAAMMALCGASAAARGLGVQSLKYDDDMERLFTLLEEGVQGTAHNVLRQLATEVLPQAAGLATVVQQQLTPEAAQLELAQAAAARSCAYLRCTNLGGEGGPAAGQGASSQRCSACRAVWYCGSACSHADWREGGHRRVCKALGAARAAEKERRRQAAAEADRSQL